MIGALSTACRLPAISPPRRSLDNASLLCSLSRPFLIIHVRASLSTMDAFHLLRATGPGPPSCRILAAQGRIAAPIFAVCCVGRAVPGNGHHHLAPLVLFGVAGARARPPGLRVQRQPARERGAALLLLAVVGAPGGSDGGATGLRGAEASGARGTAGSGPLRHRRGTLRAPACRHPRDGRPVRARRAAIRAQPPAPAAARPPERDRPKGCGTKRGAGAEGSSYH
jgi:hypothetical protein